MYYNILNNVACEYYEELKNYVPCVRQAMLFRYTTENLPLKIEDTDFIAGWCGYEDGERPPNPERKRFPHDPVLSDGQRTLWQTVLRDFKIQIKFTSAHTCIDYEAIVNNGLTHYLSRVEEALREDPQDACLRGMKISLNAVCDYADRFAGVAEEKARTAKSPEQKQRFARICSALRRVPRLGARSFLEAVQSVWILHSLIPMAEMSWSSISIGRIDQYLYPFYEKHLSEGGTKEEAKEILKNLFLLLDSYGDGACAMNIGGLDAEGNDRINDLSRLLIQVEKEMLLRAPIFAVRVTPKTPEDVLDSLIDFDLFKIGQPTFYSELPCRNAVAKRGIPEREAADFSANSCMGLILAGREFSDMWGIKFNSHLPLELAVNHGKPINGDPELNLATPPAEIATFEELLRQYDRYLSELVSLCAGVYEAVASEWEVNQPDPLLSALTEGCIQNRRDRATGATYNTVTVETMGLINTCDALSVIKKLVFEEKKYTLSDLVAAARENYEGHEGLLSDMSRCKKYGENDPDVNALIKRLGSTVSAACKKACHGNRLFLPSLHTLDVNVGYGRGLYATLDGRKSGEPVNKNANPSNLLKKVEHTSHILSAAAFDQTDFSGGQPIDLYFDRTWFETKETRDKIKALIRTYLRLGGLQLQVNSVDVDLLEKAHKAPADYPFVIVRKGGYSVRFNQMGEAEREEFIALAKRMERNG